MQRKTSAADVAHHFSRHDASAAIKNCFDKLVVLHSTPSFIFIAVGLPYDAWCRLQTTVILFVTNWPVASLLSTVNGVFSKPLRR